MKIAIVGGHLTPALALIDVLKDEELFFIGRKNSFEGDLSLSLEYQVIREKGIPFFGLKAGRLQRSINRYSISSLLKIPVGFFQSLLMLFRIKPDAVLSFGGYLSVPVGLAAFLLKIPLIIHEQTMEAGLANKILSKFASKICISWKQSKVFFPKEKVVLTGNPIRKFSIPNSQSPIPNKHLPLVYITGGSAGAHAINLLVKSCLEDLLSKFYIIHQTGDSKEFGDYDHLKKHVGNFSEDFKSRYILRKFINPVDVGNIMKDATFVVSRAGINTVTELLYFGKPCFLIPLPVGQKNEQLKNAQFIKKVGIGDFMMQKDLTPGLFLKKLETMLERISLYKEHSGYARSLVIQDAAKNISRTIYEVISKKNQ